MKVICPRCGKTIEYEREIPKKCPFCKEENLVQEKTEIEKNLDGERLKLKNSLKNISPTSKKRRFLLIPLAVFDLSIPVSGFLLMHFFTFLTYKTERFLFWIGLILFLIGLYRIIYHSVMDYTCKNAVQKENYRSVNALITRLRLKTKSDVLVILKRLIKYGVLSDVSVKNGEEIIFHDK